MQGCKQCKNKIHDKENLHVAKCNLTILKKIQSMTSCLLNTVKNIGWMNIKVYGTQWFLQFNCLRKKRPSAFEVCALCFLVHALLCWTAADAEGSWYFPECSAVSEASVSPSLTQRSPASPQWRHELREWVCLASLSLQPSICCLNTLQPTDSTWDRWLLRQCGHSQIQTYKWPEPN